MASWESDEYGFDVQGLIAVGLLLLSAGIFADYAYEDVAGIPSDGFAWGSLLPPLAAALALPVWSASFVRRKLSFLKASSETVDAGKGSWLTRSPIHVVAWLAPGLNVFLPFVVVGNVVRMGRAPRRLSLVMLATWAVSWWLCLAVLASGTADAFGGSALFDLLAMGVSAWAALVAGLSIMAIEFQHSRELRWLERPSVRA